LTPRRVLRNVPFMYPPSNASAPAGWLAGNHFRLLADGERFYPAMLEAIAAAERYVLLEMYLMESGRVAGRFVAALAAAARRGVGVHLLLDGFGARGLGGAERAAMREAGVEIAVHNPLRYGAIRRNFLRDHRKLLLVDGVVAFVGGAGITDDFLPGGEGGGAWRDTMVELRGPCVAQWRALFERDWRIWRLARVPHQPPAVTGDAARMPLGDGWVAPAPDPAGRAESGRVVHARGGVRNEIARSLIRRVRQAERRVWIATAYFAPSWKLRRTLKRAARRGVDVRLLLPGPITDHPAVRHAGRRFYARLLRHGVRIFEYQPRFLHAKMLLCDEWLSVGSSNIDRWNLRWNLEANQEVLGGRPIEQAQGLFLQDFTLSHELNHDLWQLRPWYRRLQEWFWGHVDLWLERRTRPARKQGN